MVLPAEKGFPEESHPCKDYEGRQTQHLRHLALSTTQGINNYIHQGFSRFRLFEGEVLTLIRRERCRNTTLCVKKILKN